MLSVALVAQETCTQNIGCILFTIIPFYPGLIFNLEGTASIIVSLLFWFIIGALIGLLISKLKK